jgi:hypothetical protein
MLSQTLRIDVLNDVMPLSHVTIWRANVDALSCNIEMPRGSTIAFQCASVGRILVDGDLEFDPIAASEGRRVLRWKAAAQVVGHGSASLTLSHPSDDFADVEISVEMSDEASLSVEDIEEPVAVSLSNGGALVQRYGAYISGFLGALGAMIFALLMPAHQAELISAAGFIAVGTLLFTSQGDPFFLRLLGFVAAGVTMCFAIAMPLNTDQLIHGAGVLSALTILFL